MKIEDKTKDSTVTFSDLNIGDCFLYGNYHIKIEKSDDCKFNAVSLKSGRPCYFIDNEYVINVKAKVVIGDD